MQTVAKKQENMHQHLKEQQQNNHITVRQGVTEQKQGVIKREQGVKLNAQHKKESNIDHFIG